MKCLHRLYAIAQGGYFAVKWIVERGEYAMQDGLQEIKELITREVGSLKSEVTSVCKRLDALEEGQNGLREEIEAVKTDLKAEISDLRGDLKAEISSVKSELKADIGAVKLELREESGKTHERLDKMDERFEDIDEQLETLTTSVNATQETVLRTRDHMDNRFERVEARMDHAIADLKVARSDISALRHDLQMEEESRGLSDATLFVSQRETNQDLEKRVAALEAQFSALRERAA